MPKKDHLAALIASLSPAEKKYFVQFSNLRSDEKSYMKLYDAVLNNGDFNATQLSKQLNKTKANLAHEKEYLIENILKALRSYHEKEKHIELNNTQSDIAILKERGLNELAIKRVDKANKLAVKYGRIETEWRTLFEKRLLLVQLINEADFIESSNNIMVQMNEVMQRLSDFNKLQQLFLDVENSYRKASIARSVDDANKLQNILDNPLVHTHSSDPQFRYYQLNITALVNEQLLNEHEPLLYLRKCLQLVEKYHEKIDIDTYNYFLILHGYLNELAFSDQFDLFEKMMAKVRSRYYHRLPFNKAYLDKALDAHSYYYYLLSYNFQLNIPHPPLQKIKSFLLELEEQYDFISGEFPAAYRVTIPHYACSICFALKDYTSALRWNRKIIDEGKPNERTEIYATAKMVTPIIHA